MIDSIPAKIEFEVEDLNNEKLQAIRSSFSTVKGVNKIEADLTTGKLYVDTVLPTSTIHQKIEESAKHSVILKGLGSSLSEAFQVSNEAAVAEMSNINHVPNGLIRFVQLDQNLCAIDGVIDGLSPGDHAINIFEYGDLSDGFNKLGDHYNPYKKPHGLPTDSDRHVGDLGNVNADDSGRATFRVVDNQVKIWDIIGRSICISDKPDLRGTDTGEKISCGIIARSATVYENYKKVCSCTGKTLWEERNYNMSKI